jgi:hypothetical protein
MTLELRPARRPERQDSEAPSGQVLLVSQALIGRDEYVEGGFRFVEQAAVRKLRPPEFRTQSRRRGRTARAVTAQEFPDRKGFASSGHGQTLFRVAEDGFDPIAAYAGEPFEKVVDARSVLKVREECMDRDSRAAKAPGAADGFVVSLDGCTGAPIKHR